MERREIRFLVPPVFLLGSLLWAWHCDRAAAAVFYRHRWRDSLSELQATLGMQNASAGLVLVTVALVVLASGFLVATACFVGLRLGGLVAGLRPCREFPFLALCESWNHEAVMGPKMRGKIWREHFGRRGRPRREQSSLVVAAFDQQVIDPGMRVWIERRWNTFHLDAQSVTGFVLAMGVVAFGPLDPGVRWWGSTLALCGLFVVAALCAYRDTRRMNDLLAADASQLATRKPRGRLELGPGSETSREQSQR